MRKILISLFALALILSSLVFIPAIVASPKNGETDMVSRFSLEQALDYTRIAFVSTRDGYSELYVMNANGSGLRRLTYNSYWDWRPAWSPDGKWLVFESTRDRYQDLYKMNVETGQETRLTSHPHVDTQPAWSPDGKYIAFVSFRDGNPEIYLMDAHTTEGNLTRLTNNGGWDAVPQWSPDGSLIAFCRQVLEEWEWNIWTLNPDNPSVQNQITFGPAHEQDASWSPDGSQFAYMVYADGPGCDLYLMNSDGSGQEPLKTGPESDYCPRWSPDGQKIVFYSRDLEGDCQIYTINKDGTGLTRLTSAPGHNVHPAWSPVLIPATIDLYPDELTPSTPDRVVRAYIELPDGYDVNDIDVSTVKLNDTVPAFSGPAQIGDYDNDGVPDAMVKFYRYAVEQALPQGDSVKVTVGGEVNGTTFEGSDYIRVNKGSAYGYGYP